MPRSCFYRLRLLGYLLVAGTLFFAGCTSFDHLTRMPAAGEPGPKASECGSCHVQQYHEWQVTAHAKAYTSTSFQDAAGNPPAEECLQCHSPLNLHDKTLEPRSFNREEGITCVSCHLVDGKMHGPHGSTALVSPHSIKEDQTSYTGPDFCAPCHRETQEQWRKAATRPPLSTCQECHMSTVERTVTQGTNLFSDLLVAFEKKLVTRSHDISLEKMAHFKGIVSVDIVANSSGADNRVLTVTVRNILPHDLPTGTYGEKEIRLVLVADKEDRPLNGQGVVLSHAAEPLANGLWKTIDLPIPTSHRSEPLRLDLTRYSISNPGRKPIMLASIPIPFHLEATP